MGLSVRSSRCAAVSMIIFGLLIFIPAGFYITFSLIYNFPILGWWRYTERNFSSTEFILKISWHLGYTSLLALITMITGCIGCCASGHHAHRDMCLIVTLFIFSLMVAGLSAYTIYDFSLIISVTRWLISINRCSESVCRLIFLGLESSLLGLAILVFLLSSWAIICCLASFCCHTEVEPEPVHIRQQMVGGQQGMMMQGAVMVPMMRADTVHAMAPPNPVMMQAVPAMPVHHGQGMPVVAVNQAPQQPIQAMPMQAVASPLVMNTVPQEPGNGTDA